MRTIRDTVVCLIDCLVALLLACSPCFARVWAISSPEEFSAGTGSNISSTAPGGVTLATTLAAENEFDSRSDTEPAGWTFDNPSGNSSFSFTQRPGFLRLNTANQEDIWQVPKDRVMMLTAAPPGDWVIETQVDLQRESQRHQGLVVWMDEDNYFIHGPHQTGEVRTEGWVDSQVNINYGTTSDANPMELRVAKSGPLFSTYYRAKPEDPWTLVGIYTVPQTWTNLQVGVAAKSWGAPTQLLPVDFAYFRIYSLPSSGEYLSAPFDAGGRINLNEVSFTAVGCVKLQLRGAATQAELASALWMGPTADVEFYLPGTSRANVRLNGSRWLQFRAVMDNTQGLPTLSSVSITYDAGAAGAFLLASEADFAAGTGSGFSASDVPGQLTLAYTDVFVDEFDSPNLNPRWTWDNPSGNSSYTLTEKPGVLRFNVASTEDIWQVPKNPVRLSTPAPEGDWMIETHVSLAREENRHQGLMVWQDQDNYVIFGIYTRWDIRAEGWIRNTTLIQFGQQNREYANHAYLRLVKIGNRYFGYYRLDPKSPWTLLGSQSVSGWTSPQVGLIAKSWGAATDPLPVDFDYFRIATFGPAEFVSAPFDAGAAASPTDITWSAQPSATVVKFEVRGSATREALEAAPWLGPSPEEEFYTRSGVPINPSLAGSRWLQVKAVMAPSSRGVPFLSLVRVNYELPGGTWRQASMDDFIQGTTLGTDARVSPGDVVLAGTLLVEDAFDYKTDSVPAGWVHENPSGNSTFSFTEVPGWLRLKTAGNEDIWFQVTNKSYNRLSWNTPVQGNWEAETHIKINRARHLNWVDGISVWVDEMNWLLYGPRLADLITMESNYLVDPTSEEAPFPEEIFHTDSAGDMYIRVTKIGDRITGYYKKRPEDRWTQTATTLKAWPTPLVGVMSKSWGGSATDQRPADFEYFLLRRLPDSGEYVSIPYDIGEGNVPYQLAIDAEPAGAVRLQLRGASTKEGLESAKWLGPTSETDFYVLPVTAVNPALAGSRWVQYRALMDTSRGVAPALHRVSLSYVAAAAPPAGVPGDVNGDGKVSIPDVSLALRLAVGMSAPAAVTWQNADLNKDGRIDIAEVTKLLRFAVGIIKEL